LYLVVVEQVLEGQVLGFLLSEDEEMGTLVPIDNRILISRIDKLSVGVLVGVLVGLLLLVSEDSPWFVVLGVPVDQGLNEETRSLLVDTLLCW